jgi:hypothetical protein
VRHSFERLAVFDGEQAWQSVRSQGSPTRRTEHVEGAQGPETEALVGECGVAFSRRMRTRCSRGARPELERRVIWQWDRKRTLQELCTAGLAVAMTRQFAGAPHSPEACPDTALQRLEHPGPGRLSVGQTDRPFRQDRAVTRQYTAFQTANSEVEGPPRSTRLEPRSHTVFSHPRRQHQRSRTYPNRYHAPFTEPLDSSSLPIHVLAPSITCKAACWPRAPP